MVNTTSRLEALCRSLDAPLLISSELLRRLPPLPENIQVRSLGNHALRGRDNHLAVSALTRVEAPALAVPAAE